MTYIKKGKKNKQTKKHFQVPTQKAHFEQLLIFDFDSILCSLVLWLVLVEVFGALVISIVGEHSCWVTDCYFEFVDDWRSNGPAEVRVTQTAPSEKKCVSVDAVLHSHSIRLFGGLVCYFILIKIASFRSCCTFGLLHFYKWQNITIFGSFNKMFCFFFFPSCFKPVKLTP